MRRLEVVMKNCLGIAELSHTFDFLPDIPLGRAFAIYAPNGVMKSSFAKTLDGHSRGEKPREERYGREASLEVTVDGVDISSNAIFVLKADIDIALESKATDVLVSPEHKARYDKLVLDLEDLRARLVKELQTVSGVKKSDLAVRIVEDWGVRDFGECIVQIVAKEGDSDLEGLKYSTIFDPKSVEVIDSAEFQKSARDFSERYLALFEKEGTVYKRGGFNPHGAEAVFDSMTKNHYFSAGHRVQFDGDEELLDKVAVDARLRELNRTVEDDPALKNLRARLTKNAQSQALIGLMEQLSPHELDVLIERLKPERRSEFRRELWIGHVKACKSATSYAEMYSTHRSEMASIESEAAESVDRWRAAVELYNERFTGLPFELAVENQAAAVLGQEPARLKFVFRDGQDAVEHAENEIDTLSRGEMRALYLLVLIFEVERRRGLDEATLFVIDDSADSFDYKNKNAILQYLEDLTAVENFRSLILTHNFDLFRSMTRFVRYEHCLAANRVRDYDNDTTSIQLAKVHGIKDCFGGEIKGKVEESDRSLCAAIPFVRNLLEYTRGKEHEDYVLLCDMLHWRDGTAGRTVGEFLRIFNSVFYKDLDTSRVDSIVDVISREADRVCKSVIQAGFNLEDKLLLSIAIRLGAERYIVEKCPECAIVATRTGRDEVKFGKMVAKFQETVGDAPTTRLLQKAALTVSSNIHINAFMYEPIVDLGIEDLISLYQGVRGLLVEGQ